VFSTRTYNIFVPTTRYIFWNFIEPFEMFSKFWKKVLNFTRTLIYVVPTTRYILGSRYKKSLKCSQGSQGSQSF